MQVHDELIFEVKEGVLNKNASEVKNIMEKAFKLNVPLKVDVSCGDNWEEMKEVG
jgi:DNA polymerase-1